VFGVFSLLSALAGSPLQLAGLRLGTGLGLGGGVPLAIALASDFAPPKVQGRLVILTFVGVPAGFAAGGLLASQLVGAVGWPAIFVMGGSLPLGTVPLLAVLLPESAAIHARARQRNAVAALFQDGLAPSTVLLWAINLLTLFTICLVLLWLPAILHSAGASPTGAILGATMYALGTLLSPLLTASLVDRMGIERVLTYGLAFGGLCVFSIGLLDPPFWLLLVAICGAGMGSGSQAGINSLLGLVYTPAIRSTGAGWALAAGRVGTIAGPLLGGLLLGRGLGVRQMLLAAAIPLFGAAVLMAKLGLVRPKVENQTRIYKSNGESS
jgi:AAHS family 4-hydroxybenzoate transporter-like MFS transporter